MNTKRELLNTKIEAFNDYLSWSLICIIRRTKIKTVRDFLKVDPNIFGLFKGVGKKNIDDLNNLRGIINKGL